MLGPQCPPKCYQLSMLSQVTSNKADFSPRDYFEFKDSAWEVLSVLLHLCRLLY